MPGQLGEDPPRAEAVFRGAAVALVSLTHQEKKERPALGLGDGFGMGEGYSGGFHEKGWNFPHVPWKQCQLAPRWTQLSPGRREGGCGEGVSKIWVYFSLPCSDLIDNELNKLS